MQKSLAGVSFGLLCTTILVGFSDSALAATPFRIISRSEWGADESFLYVNGEPTNEVPDTANDKTSEPDTITQRQKDCEEYHKLYPKEFVPARTVRKDSKGRLYRWPLQYSKTVKLLIVHHTAIENTGDDRTSEERMLALYEMHANGNGWGDIGYHYVIGNDGNIFEGRTGGDSVVGGQVYCGNIGTIGIALMGNFEIEKPTQAQMRSLQWLLITLTQHYRINPDGTVRFHGTEVPTIVGHRNLLSTDCPGYYVVETLNQVRTNVARNDYGTAIRFPVAAKFKSAGIVAQRQKERLGLAHNEIAVGISAVGTTMIEGRPGDTAMFLVGFQNGNTEVHRRTRIAEVSRSSNRIGLSQELGGRETSVRTDLLLPENLPPRSTQSIRLTVEYPMEPGTYTLTIGKVEYTLNVRGRRTRTEQATDERAMSSEEQAIGCSSAPCSLLPAHSIRIRLSTRENNATNCDTVDLKKLKTQYRGTLECTVIEGKAAIINTIGLEDYLAGLAEEPDTEPYEKQRAFAIAARSYAAFYLDPAQRKFPDMPYDGDDAPARFQSYKGVAFELKNPQWVKAVRSTENKVLMLSNILIKPPYFSSDDGKTRSPTDAGWKNFPNAKIFGSKPDPWCKGMPMAGHGVGMSGCGAQGQAMEGKSAEEILRYYYPGTEIREMEK